MSDEWCQPCDRWFRDEHAYWQHLDNSPAHFEFECAFCYDRFPNDDARDIHHGAVHLRFECDYCYNRFQDKNARHNHQNAVHLKLECDYCTQRFVNEGARYEHHSTADGHPWCDPCRRMFNNENNLRQHLHSSTHVGKNAIKCPFCHEGFATASGTIIHLESGRCTKSGYNKAKIDAMIQQLDRQNVITQPMLTMPGYDNQEVIATDRAWNGYGYECYLCHRVFSKLQGLNSHVRSPVHQQSIYKCPKLSCARPYKSLSGLVQHVESETCGVMRFGAVQKQAKHGIENMVGRMIAS